MFAGLGFLISGVQSVHWGLVLGVAFLSTFFIRGPFAVLRRYRAKDLDDTKHPGVRDELERLAARAGLVEAPDLKVTDRDDCDVFSVSTPRKATIVVGSAVLASLASEHLRAVLAHEVSHIKNRDTVVMGVADILVRMTRTMSSLGLILLVVNGVLTMLFDKEMPWGFVGVLIVAPFLAKGVLSLLGRARELRADRDAARLTGDPESLATALELFDAHAKPKRGLLRALNPYGIAPTPSDIRNHPKTELRTDLLRNMAGA
jgi:heat shock protein HtpX